MSKNLLQDIRKPKTIKKKNSDFINPEPVKIVPINNISDRLADSPRFMGDTGIPSKRAGGHKHALWIVAIVAVIFLFFSVSMLFSSAKIIVTPKQQDYTLNSSFNAVKDAQGNDILFEPLVGLSDTVNKIVPANGMKDSAIEATGKVVIYNTYSSNPQILAMNTKLEGSNGKIYKTDSKITVPGVLKDGTTGSVEVGIYGADAGEAYNSAPLDFKILGFKNSPKYDKIYGRSNGEIAGGFKGQVPKINDVDATAALAELKATLQSKLFKKLSYDVPPGFILFKDAVFLNINPNQLQPEMKGDAALISLKGSLSGFIFNEKILTKAIALNLMPQYDGSDVYISNIQNLTFSLSSPASDSFVDVQNITFTLAGSPKIVWRVNTEQLAADLLGSDKKDFKAILSKYPAIISAELALLPTWQSSLPKKSKDIKIILNDPK